VSNYYFIRHGQAGIRTDYDRLSDLGREQSRALGEWLASQPVEFATAIAGGLSRQQETAAAVAAAYSLSGRRFPEIVTDTGWNEFDLDGVYADIAPVLAERDPQFRAEYEQMLAHLADEDHSIHRRWTACDLAVIRAWVAGAIPGRAESWTAFQARITSAWGGLPHSQPGANIAIFTSATPIAITLGSVLNADARARFRLAGALYNTAYSVVRMQAGDASLFSFNNVPHLSRPELQTFR
jgi:broad specificity phosphatase PhoE